MMCLNQDLAPGTYGWCSEGKAACRVKWVKLIYVDYYVNYSNPNLIRFAKMIYSLYKMLNHKMYLKQTLIFFKPFVIYRRVDPKLNIIGKLS